jgi:chromodomain-helicase-DNA-binding protein 4/chromodomain-helicase-DNA-binding protein 5
VQIPPISGKALCDPVENPLPSIASFQGNMGLPNFGLEDNIPLNHMKSVPDLFPNFSMGTNNEYVRSSVPELPNSSFLPNFMADIAGTSKKQRSKLMADMSALLPGLGINPGQPIHSAMPENHKKVLDNIMMRAQYATNKFMKKRSKPDYWSEDELDALWIGVRRHGRGNWDAMLRDPKLKFLNHRTSEELAMRWILEEQKIMEEPMAAATKSNSTFPGLSDAMMSRALNGSNFSNKMEPPKLQSHLTDIQLGCSDLPSRFPHVEPSNYMSSIEGGPSLTPWKNFKHKTGYGGDFPGSTSDKWEKADGVPPYIPNPFMMETIGSLPMNIQNSSSIQQNEFAASSHENILLHGVLNGQADLFHEMQRRVKLGKQPIENTGMFGSSKSNKLPHWLQEAVRAPPSKPLEYELPATVSAIAQSVCLLLGEEKPAIPPFPFPGPRLSRPKDPRNTPKKRRVRKVQQASTQAEHPKIGSGQGDHVPTPALQLMEAPPTSTAIDHNNGAPPINLNSLSSSSACSQRQDVTPAFEETHSTLEVSEAIAATCTARSETPETGCQGAESSGVDDIASGSCRSPLRDTPDPCAPRSELSGSGNPPTEFSMLPVVDATVTSTTQAVGPMSIGDDQEPEQDNLLDIHRGIDDTKKLLEKPMPLDESRHSGASHSDSAHVVDEDKVNDIVADDMR